MTEQTKEKNLLESYEKTNEDLKTIINIDELTKNPEKYQKINLSNNLLTEISEFFIFPKLIYLDLSFNQIQRLENFSPLSELEILILSNNYIRDIYKSLFPLRKLQHLDLSKNKIDMENSSIISVLKENKELFSLLLKDNINYDFQKVKYLCLEKLEKLNFLDAIRIVSNTNLELNREIQKSYITVQGIKGNGKKISTLKEYIKFKKDDLTNNEKEYKENFNNNLERINQNIKKLNESSKSSYYFLKYLDS